MLISIMDCATVMVVPTGLLAPADFVATRKSFSNFLQTVLFFLFACMYVGVFRTQE